MNMNSMGYDEFILWIGLVLGAIAAAAGLLMFLIALFWRKDKK